MNLKLQAKRAEAVTPSDSTDIPNPASTDGPQLGCALFVGTGGHIVVQMAGGGTATFNNIANGQFLPIQVVRVLATGTTATNILALF